MASWQGTDYNERLINSVHNALVAVYLDGVEGVSTPVRGEERRLISPADADRYIAKARVVYAKLVDQKPLRSVKSWHDRHVKALDGLINKAVAVREGRAPQKMTETDYAALRKHLGLR
jgi:hypothetical protein